MSVNFSNNSSRNEHIDIIKGMLVIIMVMFHCSSMTRGTFKDLYTVKILLKFIHSAFLIITGFLCGYYYLPKIQNPSTGVRKRLLVRSGKIFLILICSNLVLYGTGFIYNVNRLFVSVTSKTDFFNNIILTLRGDLAAFEILYYITIFLIIISLLIDRISMLVIIFCIATAAVLGRYGDMIAFWGFGMVGYLTGVLYNAGMLTKTFRWIWRQRYLFPSILCFYLIFKLRFYYMIAAPGLVNFAVILLETLFWFISFLVISDLLKGTKVNKWILLFGRYTLLAYLVQMLIVRIGYLIISRWVSDFQYYVINLIVSTVVLYVIVFAVDQIRKKSVHINNFYRTVFQ